MTSKIGETLLASFGTLFQSKGLFIYFLIIFGAFNIQVVCFEEPYLTDKFGESYERYRQSVSRWIPRLTPYQENNH
jgi:protein-S-isoprenylcysteine O-methyltransferase Ste14